jgi:hypothetical protein
VTRWFVSALIALPVLVPPLLAYLHVLRADPKGERLDFLSAGNSADWDLEHFCTLRGPVGQFVRKIVAETTIGEKVDLICERIADVDAQTNQSDQRFAMLARMALAAGGFAGVVLTSQGIRQAAMADTTWGILAFLLAAVFALSCYWMGRLARHAALARRCAWDALEVMLLRRYLPAKAGIDWVGTCRSHRIEARRCSGLARSEAALPLGGQK